MIEPAVTILGRVGVSGRTRSASLGGTNLPALLCLLALVPGRAVANDRLIGALWPDADPDRGRRSLTSLVHQLNRTIDPVLGHDRTVRSVKGVGRSLRVDPASIDAVVFERRLAIGEVHAAAGRHDAAVDELSAVVALWHGAPFGGLDLPMLVEPAAQLAGSRARAERVLVDSALRSGRADELLVVLEPKVAAEPEDEQAVASLARALYQLGRQREAADVVGRCVTRLLRRGIDPTPRLRRLATAIEARSLPDHRRSVAASTTRHETRMSLVGRHHERAAIGNWFVGSSSPRSAGAGTGSVGRVLVISGEPGIGKTAVLDAWLSGMADGTVVVRSRCSPERILPFEAFSPLLTGPADGDSGDRSTRQQLFERLLERLRSMSGDGQIVLAIDDAHWMAASSVELLEQLIDSPHTGGLRVVMTIRRHEVSGNSPLERLLADWRAARQVETLELGPLSEGEIDELAARYMRTLPGPQTPHYGPGDLSALTGGNPLFVIQVAQAGEQGPVIPSTVEHLLGRYLDGQPLGVRRGVEAAALLGRDGSLALLARCTGRAELDEIEALDAVGDGRLMEVSPIHDRYRFVHELARQTVTAQIPPARAMRLHLAIADGLLGEPRPDVFAIAHHLRRAIPAGSAVRAAAALLTAAQRAPRELGDFDTSRMLAQQAFDVGDEPQLQADALVLIASAEQSVGRREDAARHIATAIEVALESNATAVLARALFVKSIVMCSGGNDELTTRIAQTVDGWLRDESSSSAHAVELVEVIWALCLDRPSHALASRRALAERALRIARASGRDLPLLQALHACQLVGQMTLADPDVVLAWGRDARQLAARTEHRMMGALIDSQIMTTLMRAGRFAEAQAVHDDVTALSVDVPDLAFRWATRARAASLALVADDLESAERLVREARDIGEPLTGGRPAEEFINHMGVLHLARGSLPGLHHLFGEWFDQPPGSVWHWAVSSGEVLDPADPMAVERFETLAANAGSALPPHSEWLPELTIAAEYAAQRRDHDLGKIVARCIEPFVHQHAVFGVTLSLGSMWRPYALALAAAGDDRSARDAMATARLVNAGAGLALWERLSRLVV